MSREDDNKAIVGRWFTHFWGKEYNAAIVDELAAPDMLLQYSLHAPRRGRDDIKAFMKDFRKAFPDLNFWGTADLIAEGDYVVGRWEGGGTHSGPAFSDFLVGSLPANTGKRMKFTGTTVLKVKDGKIVEEIGLDDGVTALQQLGSDSRRLRSMSIAAAAGVSRRRCHFMPFRCRRRVRSTVLGTVRTPRSWHDRSATDIGVRSRERARQSDAPSGASCARPSVARAPTTRRSRCDARCSCSRCRWCWSWCSSPRSRWSTSSSWPSSALRRLRRSD